MTLESAWVVLAALGLCSLRSWAATVALATMGAVQLAGAYTFDPVSYSLAAPMVELAFAVLICTRGTREDWRILVGWLFFASLTVQALGALAEIFGLSLGRALYVVCNTIFTAQLLCVAFPGGQCLVRSVRRLGNRSARRRVDRQEYAPTFGAR